MPFAEAVSRPSPAVVRARLRVASVAYFNSKSLIAGLDADPLVDLSLEVPSGLLGRLQDGSADVALLPTIDLQREPGLRVIPSGGIGCDGPTLTVRLFAKRPFDQIRRLAVDPDSHTSAVLSRLLLRRVYGVTPPLIDLRDAGDDPAEARLLIGDKVITSEPRDFPHQLDLGEAWKAMTGLPFVFAVWTARAGVDLGDLPKRLVASREFGMTQIDRLVRAYAVPRGWPAGVARQYLTKYLKFPIGPRQIEAIRLFHRLAAEDGLIRTPPAPLALI